MEKENKHDAKPCGNNVGNKHGSEVEAGFRFEIKTTMRAHFIHLKGLLETKASGREEITSATARAF